MCIGWLKLQMWIDFQRFLFIHNGRTVLLSPVLNVKEPVLCFILQYKE